MAFISKARGVQYGAAAAAPMLYGDFQNIVNFTNVNVKILKIYGSMTRDMRKIMFKTPPVPVR